MHSNHDLCQWNTSIGKMTNYCKSLVQTQIWAPQIRLTSRLGFTEWLRPQVQMHPVRNARRTSCPILSSELAQIPNFRMCSIPHLWTRPMSRFWTYLFAARLCHTLPAANGVVRCATGTPLARWCLQRARSIGRGCRVHTCVMAIGADFKMYLLRQFCSNRVNFFTIHRRHKLKKW